MVEVDAAIGSYFAMLEKELRGERYSKTEFRRALLPLLSNREESAIERKHQNISAVLIELHAPYIAGYKPLGNYQMLLFERVSERLDAATTLRQQMTASAEKRPRVPAVDDILSSLVDVPRASGATRLYEVRDRATTRIRRVDYLAIEARNRQTGDAGEEFVRRYETARLIAARREQLASKVERVSVTRGDGEGFDILSYEEDGRERLIEVKATKYGAETPFFVTPNERDTSEIFRDRYYLYRVFEIERQPRFFYVPGQLDEAFSLSPSEFVARVK